MRMLASITMRLLCNAGLSPSLEIGDQFLLSQPKTPELCLHTMTGLQKGLAFRLAGPFGYGNIETDGFTVARHLNRHSCSWIWESHCRHLRQFRELICVIGAICGAPSSYPRPAGRDNRRGFPPV